MELSVSEDHKDLPEDDKDLSEDDEDLSTFIGHPSNIGHNSNIDL